MIKIKNIPNDEPYKLFIKYFEEARKAQQAPINALSISSYDIQKKEVDSRFVNLKCILQDEWIFFTNYKSPKACAFEKHKQISALIYWSSINIQIRIKAEIKKTSKTFSDEYFKSRQPEKNALAISSHQSKKVDKFETIKKNFEYVRKNHDLTKRPEYWGGFAFTPYYFEFWKGDDFRLNSRDVFELKDDKWLHFKLQP